MIRSLLSASEEYSGIIFTSQRAVEAASEAVRDWSLVAKNLKCFVVGPATEKAARNLGFDTSGSDSGNAKALATQIISWFSSLPRPRPLIFPCADIRRDSLPDSLKAANVPLIEIVSYETKPHSKLKENVEAFYKNDATPDVVIFYSPSSVNFALPILKESEFNWRAATKFVSIGPSTTEVLIRDVPDVLTASAPNPEAVVDLLKSL